MKLEETNVYGVDGAISAEVLDASGRQQRLTAEGGTLTLSEGNSRLRCWPLHVVRIKTDLSVCDPTIPCASILHCLL